MNQSWYNNSENEKENWYAPPAENEEEPAPERPSRSGWLKPLISVLLVIALIAGSSAAFAPKRTLPAETQQAQEREPVSPDGGTESGEPKDAEPKEDSPSGIIDDFREFFKNYYTPQEEHEKCTIPTVKEFPGISLTLMPTGGKDLSLQEVYAKCSPSVVAVTAFINEKSD